MVCSYISRVTVISSFDSNSRSAVNKQTAVADKRTCARDEKNKITNSHRTDLYSSKHENLKWLV